MAALRRKYKVSKQSESHLEGLLALLTDERHPEELPGRRCRRCFNATWAKGCLLSYLCTNLGSNAASIVLP